MVNTQMNQKQREAFQEVLRQKFQDAKRILSNKTGEAQNVAFDITLQRFGGTELLKEALELQKKLDAVEQKLAIIGVELREGSGRIGYTAPEDVEVFYHRTVAEQVAPEQKKVEVLDKAIHDAWSIATLPEAKKLVESFA